MKWGEVKTRLNSRAAGWQRYLLLSVFIFTILVSCSQSANSMAITGNIRSYETNSDISNAEVNLSTYRQPELPQLPPIGDIIATTYTDLDGVYEFEIQLSSLPSDANKLVVSVDRGVQGWKVITINNNAAQVDLVKGSIVAP